MNDDRDQNHTETRISLIEQMSDAQNRRIDNLEVGVAELDDKLQQNIQIDTATHTELRGAVSQMNMLLESLTKSMVLISQAAQGAADLAKAHQTIGLVLIKVATAVAVITSGAWAAFTFFNS